MVSSLDTFNKKVTAFTASHYAASYIVRHRATHGIALRGIVHRTAFTASHYAASHYAASYIVRHRLIDGIHGIVRHRTASYTSGYNALSIARSYR